nr:MADS-box protein AGL24-like [Tanacetum cinerariifolium]
MMEENKLLKQEMMTLMSKGKRPWTMATELDNLATNHEDQEQSSDSVTTNASGPPPEDDCSDTALILAEDYHLTEIENDKQQRKMRRLMVRDGGVMKGI